MTMEKLPAAAKKKVGNEKQRMVLAEVCLILVLNKDRQILQVHPRTKPVAAPHQRRVAGFSFSRRIERTAATASGGFRQIPGAGSSSFPFLSYPFFAVRPGKQFVKSRLEECLRLANDDFVLPEPVLYRGAIAPLRSGP